jgi:hypothetical protein
VPRLSRSAGPQSPNRSAARIPWRAVDSTHQGRGRLAAVHSARATADPTTQALRLSVEGLAPSADRPWERPRLPVAPAERLELAGAGDLKKPTGGFMGDPGGLLSVVLAHAHERAVVARFGRRAVLDSRLRRNGRGVRRCDSAESLRPVEVSRRPLAGVHAHSGTQTRGRSLSPSGSC